MRKPKLTQASLDERSEERAGIGAILAESIFCTNLSKYTNFYAIFVLILYLQNFILLYFVIALVTFLNLFYFTIDK